jgi:hypothetical protein
MIHKPFDVLPFEMLVEIMKFRIAPPHCFVGIRFVCQTWNKAVAECIYTTTTCIDRFDTRIHLWDSFGDSNLKRFCILTSLDLSYNYVITNDGLKYLRNLTSLSLRYNEMITDDGICSLSTLTYLDIRRNFKITPEGTKNLSNLTNFYRVSKPEREFILNREEARYFNAFSSRPGDCIHLLTNDKGIKKLTIHCGNGSALTNSTRLHQQHLHIHQNKKRSE